MAAAAPTTPKRHNDDVNDDPHLISILSAIAETLWPSLPDDAALARASGRPDAEAVARFLETSGRDYGGEVLTLVRAQLAPEARDQLLMLLRMLRKRSASPVLLGPRLCLPTRRRQQDGSPSKPWRLRRFEELSVAERERVLLAWQRSPIPALRLAFKALKSLVAGTVLTSVTAGKGAPRATASVAAAAAASANGNGNGHGAIGGAAPNHHHQKKSNPFWAGMGYSPEGFVGSVAPADAADREEAGGGGKKAGRGGKNNNKTTTTTTPSPPAVYAATLSAEEILASAVLDAPSAAREARQAGGGGDSASASARRWAERLSRARFSVVDEVTTTTTTAPLIPTATIEADAVIVGSGAGGAVAACLLARAGLRVVVVEKGPWRRARDISPYEGESMRFLYESAGFVSTRDGAVGVLAGSALGGGTKINWCASLRTPQHVRDEWSRAPHGLGETVSGARFDAALDAVCERLLGAGWRLGGGGDGADGGAPVVVRPGASCWSNTTTTTAGDEQEPSQQQPTTAKTKKGKQKQQQQQPPIPAAATNNAKTPTPASDPLDRGQGSGLSCCPHPHACTTERAGSNARLWDGLAALGASPRELPRNCASSRCSASCSFGCAAGNKASADVSWLADAARTGKCLVLARCHAQRVLLEDGDRVEQQQQQPQRTPRPKRAAGVELEVLGCEDAADDGPWAPADAPVSTLARVVVRAPLVFSAAGSLHTPALLLRSGVTSGGAVGKHLRLHPASGVVARFLGGEGGGGGEDDANTADANANDGPVPLTFSSSPSRPAVDMYRGVMMATYSTFAARWPQKNGSSSSNGGKRGPTAAAAAAAKPDDNDGYGAMVSVPVCHPGMLGATCQWESGRAFKRTLLPAPDLALFLVFARDGGPGGRVLLGRDGRPALDYWPRARDRRSMLDGLELSVRAAVAAGACEVFLPHNTLGRLRLAAPMLRRRQAENNDQIAAAERADAQALETYVQRLRALGVPKYDLAVLSAHQMGSARMGSKKGASAFDARGECWDVGGLYVADASAFPTPSGVNPMVTVQALAHVVASGVAADAAEAGGRAAAGPKIN